MLSDLILIVLRVSCEHQLLWVSKNAATSLFYLLSSLSIFGFFFSPFFFFPYRKHTHTQPLVIAQVFNEYQFNHLLILGSVFGSEHRTITVLKELYSPSGGSEWQTNK